MVLATSSSSTVPVVPGADASRSPSLSPSAVSSSPPASSDSTPAFLQNDPARTGYDPSLQCWKNYMKILAGKITPEGIEHYREDRYKELEREDCARCEADRDWLFAHSPTVRFLRDKIAALGGELHGDNVVCKRCPGRWDSEGRMHRQGGGFSPNQGILLCANEIRNRSRLEEVLGHEMVHAWDHLRWKVDWVGEKDLRHAACTEIRASMLSGECRFTREAFTRGNWGITQQFQRCVRERAVLSVMNRPTCKNDAQAVKAVNSVWDSCFADTRPFDSVYK